MSPRPVELPRHLYRVAWEAGFGWPDVTHRLRKYRNYANAASVARQLAAIYAFPEHHKLVGVYESSPITWTPVDPATFPLPEEHDAYDDDTLDATDS